jgi:signal transduction histidine kinase
MSEGNQYAIATVPLESVADALSKTLPFAGLTISDFGMLGPVERIEAAAGSTLTEPKEIIRGYGIVLQGEIRAERVEPDGSRTLVWTGRAGEGFGETPLLTGKAFTSLHVQAIEDTVILRISEDGFWALMACCPAARKVILRDMTQRLQAHQVEALHREKLVSLGTLAAGLMHELHNPGSAAKRSAAQLRQNILRLQQLALRFSTEEEGPKTPAQAECMRFLLERTMGGCQIQAMGSLEQADAEEEMSTWLADAGVENAFSIAPALVGIGLQKSELACAKDVFPPDHFSNALNWLEALVSSSTLVCTIEESISRISELVMAVKKFAYEGKIPSKELDVHDSLQSTLTILGHKLRMKGIKVEKDFSASPALIHTRGSSLGQVWTNLIDNALDASPTNSSIRIATWIEGGTESHNGKVPAAEGTSDKLVVSIEDHGEGIPPESLPRIFEAFYTTKPLGTGTGLGLEIVHRIVTQKFGGTIDVQSQPGSTRFVVRLPLAGRPNNDAPAPGLSFTSANR